jgi:hypothetical protein
MTEVETRLHALLFVELLAAIAAEDEAGDGERPVPVAAVA